MVNKIRIAPTPSGFLHLGNVLSFALTAALAQRVNARILLRIDDLDRQRANPAYVQDVFDTLDFLEIPWHEGPRSMQEFEQAWSQLHRMVLYEKALQQLQNSRQVFACTCSRSQIRNITDDECYPGICCAKTLLLTETDCSWRLQTDVNKQLKVNLWPAGEKMAALPASMQYFVVRKKDGFPAYQLSSLVDDLHFGITHVVRGADLWPSTLAQLHLADLLGAAEFSNIQFYHHSLLMARGEHKLSKSAGATSVHYLRQQGYTPAKVYQQIAQHVGIQEPVANWMQLADAFWRHEELQCI